MNLVQLNRNLIVVGATGPQRQFDKHYTRSLLC